MPQLNLVSHILLERLAQLFRLLLFLFQLFVGLLWNIKTKAVHKIWLAIRMRRDGGWCK
jgi:hypothetical protein